MKKKLTAILLCIAMLSILFAGCSTTEPASSTAEQPEAESSVEVTTPPEAEADTSEPVEETSDSIYPLVDEPETLTMWATATTQVIQQIEDLNNHQGYAMAEDITGVHIDITTVQTDAASEKLSLLVAAGEYPDIFRGASFPSGDLDAYETEVIIDVTDYLEEYAPNYYGLISNYDVIGQNVCTDEGYHLSFYRIYQEKGGYDSIGVGQGLQIRQDLLDELGLEMPTSMEELKTVLTSFRNDIGLTDAVLLQGSITDMGDTLISSFGIGSAFYNKEGTAMYGPLQEEFKEYLKLLNEWYEAGILNSNFISYSSNPNDENVISKVTAYDGVGIFFSGANDMATRREQSAEGMMYVGMPALKGPDGQNHFGLDAAVVKGASYYISTQCENVELAVQWNDFWYGDEGILISNFGKEGQTFEYDADGKPQWTDFVTNNPDGLSQGVVRQVYLMYTTGGICINDNEMGMLDDIAQEAVEAWTSSSDRAYLMPTVSYTTEESSERATLLSDITTYNEEVQFQMVIGTLDVDEYWDTYQETLKSMNIDRVLEITQDALNRFYAR